MKMGQMNWIYKGKEFTSDDIGEHIGFVYIITSISDNKKYIGKKKFWSVTKRPPLKGKKRRRTIIKESDWKNYFGSSENVKALVEEQGADAFKREILHLCDSLGEMSYLELVEQIDRKVLFSDEYHNGIIQCRINQSHLTKMDPKKL